MTRQSYRMYLKKNPIGISIYAYKFYVSDDCLFFSDKDGDTVCSIGSERVDRVLLDSTSPNPTYVFQSEK